MYYAVLYIVLSDTEGAAVLTCKITKYRSLRSETRERSSIFWRPISTGVRSSINQSINQVI